MPFIYSNCDPNHVSRGLLMKKFVIVIISFLVLFIFLVLNYLLWDKENLLKQRDTDKIQQDWLRGENLTLRTTVEELEQSVSNLEEEKDAQRDEIVELEQQVRLALQRENSNLKAIQEKDQALYDYKLLMSDELKSVATLWFSHISKSEYEESFNLLDKDFTLWNKRFNLQEYIEFISEIKSITLQEEPKDSEDKAFIILGDGDEPYIIKTQIKVNIDSKESKIIEDLESGANTLEVSFKYNRDTSNWVIMSILTLRIGKP